MLKYINQQDRTLFEAELKVSNLSCDEFMKKRKITVGYLADFQKSQQQKHNWRANRWKYLKGINRFHRSTKGKRFHRELGRFLATRDLSKLSYAEALELVMPLTSALTHCYTEFGYYIPLSEHVEYLIFSEYLYDQISKMLIALKKVSKENFDEELLIRLTETNSLIKSFADKSGKSEQEVELLWDKAKELVKKEYNKSEDEDEFYKILVGILKKMLGV